MAELLKRILTANRPNVFIPDLNIKLRNVGDSIDLLALIKSGVSSVETRRRLEEIGASHDLDASIQRGWVTLTDQDGIVLNTSQSLEATNLLTLHENAGGGGGSSTFIGLTDTPATYVGSGLRLLRVNAGETSVQFVSPTNLISLADLSDVNDAASPDLGSILKGDGSEWDEFIVGAANQILGVNTGGTDLEYKTLTAGANITITPAAGSLTIASTTAAAHDLLSVTHSDAVAASPVLGDLIYGDATPEWNRLAGSVDSAQRILTQTGTGVISAVPSWEKSITLQDLTLTNTTSPPLTLPNAGSAPTGAAGAVTIVNNQMYVYDNARGKYLTPSHTALQWGRKGKSSGVYLDFGGTSAHEDSGARMLLDGTIVGITATNADPTSSNDFEILINNVVVESFSLSSGNFSETTTDRNFSANAIISVRAVAVAGAAAKADNPTVILWVKFRV